MKYLFAEVRDGCYETFCEGETACGCKPVTEGDEGVKACASEARGGSYSGEKDHPLNTIRPFLAILLCNTVALAGGCVAGPEAVAAAMGSAGADFFTTHINFMQGRWTVLMGGERGGRELFALAGMVGGISSIFPSPIAAILLVLEISQVAGRRFEIDFPGTSQSQSVILQRMHSSSLYLLYFTTSALVSVTSYAICQGVLYITYKQDLNIVVPLAYVEPPVQTPLGVGEQVATQAIGALAGLFGSLVSFIFIAMQIFARRSARKCTNLTNRAWKKMMKRFCKGNNSPPQEQVLPGLIVTQFIAGAISGALAWGLPAVPGAGEEGLIFLSRVRFNSPGIDASLLLATAVGKLTALAVCLGAGMTGGIIFPLLFVGGALGCSLSAATGWNRLLCLSTMSASTVASHLPAPLAFSVLVLAIFGGGQGQGLAVLIAVVVSMIVGVVGGGKGKFVDVMFRGGGEHVEALANEQYDRFHSFWGEEMWGIGINDDDTSGHGNDSKIPRQIEGGGE